MALVVKDRVQETSTTTGTGTLTLGGAVTGFQTFSSAIGNTNTTYYTIQAGSEWEVGIGTVGAGTLARNTVLESSNSGSLVNFSSGTKYVFCTYPAEKSVDIETAQTLTNKTISGSSNTLSNIANSSLTNSAITINGSSTSLGGSVNVGTVTSVSALTLGTTGTDLSSSVATGTTTPVITLNVPTASSSNRGALSNTDWSTFNNKQDTLVSGTNIKTINGSSVLGSGNLAVGGMTLLGTLTTTSGSTQTLSSLTLTDYKQLQLVFNGVSSSVASGNYRITDPDTTVLTLGAVSSASQANRISAIVTIDLSTGILIHVGYNATSSSTPNIGTGQTPVAGKTTFSTSATAVTISLSTGNFDAGSILVYGVK